MRKTTNRSRGPRRASGLLSLDVMRYSMAKRLAEERVWLEKESEMASGEHNFVLFKTARFVFDQPDEDIDCWFVGGDCAGWFYARLLPRKGIVPDCEPVMEDWGWIFSVLVEQIRVSVSVWAYLPLCNCWLLGVGAKKRLFARHCPEVLVRAKDTVCEAFDEIMNGDPEIAKCKWYAESPFELMVQEF